MNSVLRAFLLSSIAGLSTVIGALFIFLPIKENNRNKFISFSLAFSMAIMIGVSLFDLLPSSFFYFFEKYSWIVIPMFAIIFYLSYILINFINKLLKKYESNLYKLGILSMITLMIHNFPEGILSFVSSYKDVSLGIKLTIAITLHNIPEDCLQNATRVI